MAKRRFFHFLALATVLSVLLTPLFQSHPPALASHALPDSSSDASEPSGLIVSGSFTAEQLRDYFGGDPPATKMVSVKLKSHPSLWGASRLAAASRLSQDLGATLYRHNELLNIATLRAPAGMPAADFAAQVALDPRVQWVEEVQWRRLSGVMGAPITPNDDLYNQFQKWYYDLIGMPETWGLETGKPTVTIAVVDSGVMCTHPDLSGNIWVNSKEIAGNGLDDDKNGYIDDVNGYDFVGAETGNESAADLPGDSDPCVKAGDPSVGNGLDDDNNGTADDGVTHGTFVAGVVAAIGNNRIGMAGMCWGCKVMPLRVANPEGWLRSNDDADAIVYAATNGAKVINLSLGGAMLSQAESDAITLATNAGVVVVAAAGNENQTPMAYPARLAKVLAVGASNHANTKGRAPFSNWGTGIGDNRLVDVVAPGVDIASLGVNSMADQQRGLGIAGAAKYMTGAGTSFSCPLVAGLIGIMLSRNSTLTASQLRTNLMSTAMPLGDDPVDSPNAGINWAGAGMINALAAVNAGGLPTVTPTPTPTVSPAPSATPTPTPLPAGSKPALLSPANGAQLTGLGSTLTWNVAAGATQYQIQILPANNDGPAINLIMNIGLSYTIDPPVFGTGPYVMLPGISYNWKVRTTTATTGIDENSPLWGPWSDSITFKTRTTSSNSITPTAPALGSTVATLTPTLQWTNSDANVFYYEVQLSKDPNFGSAGAIASVYYELRHGGATTPPNSYLAPTLEPGTPYFWRVRPRIQGDGTPVAWTASFTFKTP